MHCKKRSLKLAAAQIKQLGHEMFKLILFVIDQLITTRWGSEIRPELGRTRFSASSCCGGDFFGNLDFFSEISVGEVAS